jgi:hypothetical protein
VIVLAVVVLVLAGAYRSLGGASPRVADSAALLTVATARLRDSLAALPPTLDANAGADGQPGTSTTRDTQRAGAAVQQLLDRLPGDAELHSNLVAARVLLADAADDTAWAWRMATSGGVSPGLTAALTALRAHAMRCCTEAEQLLGVESLGDPQDPA